MTTESTTEFPPQRPEAGRPPSVKAAAGLLALAALIQAVNAWASAQAAGPVVEVYRQYAGDEIGAKHAWIVENNYTGMIWQGVVLAAVFGVLAVLVWFPLRWPRVVATAVGGLVAFWNLLSFAFATSTPLGANANLVGDHTTELSRKVFEVAPPWSAGYGVVEALVSTGLLIAAIVLLRSAPARRYYSAPAV
ncbi:MAG: hypothetical protein HOV79_24795 [Hamadaea sp.]|nr:hypothetical protein [Hamadaea sp.]